MVKGSMFQLGTGRTVKACQKLAEGNERAKERPDWIPVSIDSQGRLILKSPIEDILMDSVKREYGIRC